MKNVSKPTRPSPRAERQGDSFLRQFNDGDAAWKVMADVKEIGFDFEDLGTSVGGATKKIEKTPRRLRASPHS